MVPLDTVVECCPSLELLELFDEIKGCRQMVPLDAVVEWLRWTLSLNVAPVEGLRNVDTVVE